MELIGDYFQQQSVRKIVDKYYSFLGVIGSNTGNSINLRKDVDLVSVIGESVSPGEFFQVHNQVMIGLKNYLEHNSVKGFAFPKLCYLPEMKFFNKWEEQKGEHHHKTARRSFGQQPEDVEQGSVRAKDFRRLQHW